jgi:hypothetical protein
MSFRAQFAVEAENWDETLAYLNALGITYSRAGHGVPSRAGSQDHQRRSKRDNTGEHCTHIHDPDGNRIERGFTPVAYGE